MTLPPTQPAISTAPQVHSPAVQVAQAIGLPQGVFQPKTPGEVLSGMFGKFGAKPKTEKFVLQFAEQADLSAIEDLPRGLERRTAAWDAIVGAASRSQSEFAPVLGDWKSQGLVDAWDGYALGNTLEVTVPAKARDAFEQAATGTGRFALVQHVQEDANVLPIAPRKQRQTAPEVYAHEHRNDGPKDDETFQFRDGEAWQLVQTGVDELHRSGITGAGVRVGIIDTGADLGHPDLAHAWRGDSTYGWLPASEAQRDTSDRPVDDGTHGTHVAGIIASDGAGGHHAGLAPGVELMVASMARPSTIGSFEWFLAPGKGRFDDPTRDPAKGADIVSNSWGLVGPSAAQYGKALEPALEQLRKAGVVTIFAAGNFGDGFGTVLTPGSSEQVITVGATSRDGTIAKFSSRDRGGKTDAQTKPDIVAPGAAIPSTMPRGKVDDNLVIARLANWITGGALEDLRAVQPVKDSDGSLWTMSGTSMAAPAVSGMVALVLQQHPTLDQDDVKAILRDTAIDMGAPGVDPIYGAGRIDPVAALAAAAELEATRGIERAPASA